MKRVNPSLQEKKRVKYSKKEENVVESIEKNVDDTFIIPNEPKTGKGKRYLKKLEPQVFEDFKKIIFLRNSKSNVIKQFLIDLSIVSKPFSHFLNRKEETFNPFSNPQTLEYLCKKNQAPLFCYGSTNKKNNNRVYMGRLFEYTVLDLFECEVLNFVPLSNFLKNEQPQFNTKPLVLAMGSEFESSTAMQQFRNFLIDFFSRKTLDKMYIKGIQEVIVLTSTSLVLDNIPKSVVFFKRYRLVYTDSSKNLMMPNSLSEIGPSFTLILSKYKLPNPSVWKKAIQQPSQLKKTKKKNIKTTSLRETMGRVHVGVQNLQKLNTPLYH